MAVNQSPGQIVCSTSLMASLRSNTKYPPDVARVGPWNSLPGKVKTDRMAFSFKSSYAFLKRPPGPLSKEGRQAAEPA